jgi:hypothetical protein
MTMKLTLRKYQQQGVSSIRLEYMTGRDLLPDDDDNNYNTPTGGGLCGNVCLPPTVATMPRACSVPGCAKPIDSLGYCAMHAQRVRRYGDPNYVTPEETRRANNREAQLARFEPDQIKPTTYRKRNGRHEHRVVAEEMLGRPLNPGEIVHHIDGDRHNNDPANLRVMTQSEHMREHLHPGDGLIAWNGQAKTAKEWASYFGFPKYVMHNRLRAGWSMDRIASTPIRKWVRGDG